MRMARKKCHTQRIVLWRWTDLTKIVDPIDRGCPTEKNVAEQLHYEMSNSHSQPTLNFQRQSIMKDSKGNLSLISNSNNSKEPLNIEGNLWEDLSLTWVLASFTAVVHTRPIAVTTNVEI